MKKRKALNNKGFVLAETLVVAVAVSAIFTLMFKNFYPLMGEYELREDYDDIDSKYGTYWIKRILQSADYDFSKVETNIEKYGAHRFDCNEVADNSKKEMCYQLIDSLEISCDDPQTNDAIEKCSNHANLPHIYVTRYSMAIPGSYDLKQKIIETSETKKTIEHSSKPYFILSSGLIDYINYLPNYSKVVSVNKAQYRIIIEYYRHRFDTPSKDSNSYIVDKDNDFRTYSTIEVKK